MAAAAILVLLTLAGPARPARAQTPAGPAQGQTPTPGAIDFVAQTPFLTAPDGQWGVRFKVTRPSGPSNLEVAVSVYAPVAFRSEFQETLENRIFGEPELPVGVFPLGSLVPEPNGDYAIALTAALGAEDGVHPVRVELRDRDDFDVLDEFVTHLVYLPGQHIGDKLGVSVVLPVHDQPALQPDGTRRRPDEAELAGLALAIDAAGNLPVSFVPTPETVATLVASNDPRAGAVLKSLRDAVAGRSLIGGTYVPVSLPALTTAGLEDEVALQMERGTTTLSEVLRVPEPMSRTWVAEEPLDAASIDLLAARYGVDQVVAPEAGLTEIPDQLVTLTGPFELDGERSSVHGAAADAGLSAHFVQTDQHGGRNPALEATHLLADLAVLYLDLPGEQRGVVALAPRDWQPDRVFLDTLRLGLTGNPAVQAIALDDFFSTVPDATDLGEPLVRRPAVDPGGSLTGLVEEIRAVRGRLDALGSVLGPTNAVSGDLGERLLVAESADLRTVRDRQPYLGGVRQAIDEQLGGIVMPQNRSITLTARRGEIPVTFQNHTGHPVKVVVIMESDKLDFPGGNRLEIDLTRLNTTHRFPVVARTSGAFPIRITLESPDGDLIVGRARLTVRSTATSGVGLMISVGAALFLAVWWGRHALKGRRAKRLMEPSEVAATMDAAPTPTARPLRIVPPAATVRKVPVPPRPPPQSHPPAGPPNPDVPAGGDNDPPVSTPGTLGGG
ncbi:MAG: hypothetical protein QOG43_562 [Actinomycetota bacterium]|jgi:hypothetical protein|nr:hypothetical protein [Actinomycetota bacterium]